MGLFDSVFGGGSSKQEVKNDPWSGVQPYLKDIFQLAQQQYQGYSPQYYPGQTFAPMDPLQMGAQQMALSQVFGNSGLPNWWSPQMPDSSGALTGSFEQPYNAPPRPKGAQPVFGSLAPGMGGQPAGGAMPTPMGNPYIPGAQQSPYGPAASAPGSPSLPGVQQMPQGFDRSNPLPRSEYFLAPGQTGSAYDIGGGRTLYEGGAQPEDRFRRNESRRANQELGRMRSNLGISYDRNQFSPELNDYLNNRVTGWGGMGQESQNRFLNRLVGFRELEQQRRAGSPEYAALATQLGGMR